MRKLTEQEHHLLKQAGWTGKQTRKVLGALLIAYTRKVYWVDGMDLMADYNSAARSRIADLRAQGIEIESRQGEGATYCYRLTDKGYEQVTGKINLHLALDKLGAKIIEQEEPKTQEQEALPAMEQQSLLLGGMSEQTA